MKDYRFLHRADYFTELSKKMAGATPKTRVIIAALSFSPKSTLIASLIAEMIAAAKRGVRVTLLIDAVTLLADNHGLPLPSLSLNKFKTSNRVVAARQRALQQLQAAGVGCHIVNVPQRRVGLVQQGRSHIKAAVIGDDVYVGGCNLAEPEQLDVMVGWHDSKTADILATWLMQIAESDQTREAFDDVDIEAQLDDQTTLLLDAGVPHQSLIYDEALSLIDNAEKSLFITCQYFPGGETARHLAMAKARGVNVQISYSHPRSHYRSAVLHHVHQFAQRRRNLPQTLFSGRLDKTLPLLHAKVLVSEKAALVGSHNYVIQGVNLGTAELALRSTDPAFGHDLREYIEQQIGTVLSQ